MWKRTPPRESEPAAGPRPGLFAGTGGIVAARVGMAVSAVGLTLTILLGAAAPNANSAAVRGPLAVLPPLPPLVSNLTSWASSVLAGIGLSALLLAYARGWRPPAARLTAMSAGFIVVLVNLTPVGSSDTASYANYGRLFVEGLDPYFFSPVWLGEPYATVVATQWLTTPSVYGPFATFLQAGAAALGTPYPAVTIWFLMVANGTAFLLVGWLLNRISPDPVRATLLWTANPLLIQQLVGGGHVDTFVVLPAVAAVFLVSRNLVSGALVGVACGFKANAALVGAGLAWERLRERDYLGVVRLGAAALAVLTAAYLLVGRQALRPLLEASGMVGAASPWSILVAGLNQVADHDLVAVAARFGWPLAMVAVAVLLFRLLPADAPRALRTQLAMSFGWVLVAPWVMPWYAALAWGFLAQLPANRLTRWLLLYTVVQACLHNSGGWDTGYTT
ncbi:MAG: hypothetical protein ACRDOO_12105 [Actinomadura sp.]